MPPEKQSSFWPHWPENKLFTVLVAILLAYAIIFMYFVIRNEDRKFDHIGKAPAERHTVTIDGTGKVVGTPDIATVELGFTTQKNDVQGALKENNEKMNRLNDELKKLGIKAADIQTTRFNVYPNYDYTKPRAEIIGYTADQGVTVKIRNLAQVNAVLAAAGNVGTNQVSGLSFTIDDPNMLRGEAREKAIKNAVEKAETLAAQLGVRLTRIVNFSETSGGAPSPYIYSYAREGLGGGEAPPPQVESGSLEVNSNVSITFELE